MFLYSYAHYHKLNQIEEYYKVVSAIKGGPFVSIPESLDKFIKSLVRSLLVQNQYSSLKLDVVSGDLIISGSDAMTSEEMIQLIMECKLPTKKVKTNFAADTIINVSRVTHVSLPTIMTSLRANTKVESSPTNNIDEIFHAILTGKEKINGWQSLFIALYFYSACMTVDLKVEDLPENVVLGKDMFMKMNYDIAFYKEINGSLEPDVHKFLTNLIKEFPTYVKLFVLDNVLAKVLKFESDYAINPILSTYIKAVRSGNFIQGFFLHDVGGVPEEFSKLVRYLVYKSLEDPIDISVEDLAYRLKGFAKKSEHSFDIKNVITNAFNYAVKQ